MDIVEITSELEKHPPGTFLDLIKFNDNSVGACRITGTSPVWEMHPETDEFFHILEGKLEMTLLEDKGPNHYCAEAGSVMVIPKGVWHKPSSPDGVRFVYFTPGQSLHSDLDDPRQS